jgi:hypothetical protein
LKLNKPHDCQHEAEWVDGLTSEQCPVLWLDKYSQVIKAYQYEERGILPHSGGWADQPALMMQMTEAFRLGVNLGRPAN